MINMGQIEVLNVFPKEADICYKELFKRIYPNIEFKYSCTEYQTLTSTVNNLRKNKYIKLSRLIGRTAYYKRV